MLASLSQLVFSHVFCKIALFNFIFYFVEIPVHQ